MGDTLDHTLVNPNQLPHYGTRFQDNPMSESPIYIITEDYRFSMEISMEVTVVFANTHTPSDNQLQEFPHTNLSSPHPCDPMKVCLPEFYRLLEEEVGGVRYISAKVASHTE